MVRIQLRFPRPRIVKSRDSRIHQVHARAIWDLHVNLVRSMGPSRALTRALSP